MLDDLIQTPQPATKADTARLAELIVIAGDGLPLVAWQSMQVGSESLMDIGTARASRDTGGFSFRNADVVRVAGEVVSALVSYPITEETSAKDMEVVPNLFKPLVALENLAVPSWYINVLATDERARCKGAGTMLLAHAEAKARASGYDRVSLITGDINPARRLYEKLGFRIQARDRIEKKGGTMTVSIGCFM
ncbi:GNAT family N-acetyltransferase [Roseobacter sp.]|uniref:GNAT family N-acetyltransferase n=1 Tax=Roseobacter sp. TaxID=1907202 RepID=UPI003859B8EE